MALPPRFAFAVLAVVAAAGPVSAQNPGMVFFEQKIRPALLKHCYSCHSTETPKGPKGGLLVDSRAGLLTGGDSGPALVPGKVEESLLIKALRHDDLAMPPKGKLSDEVIADFERWVKMGAPDPRDGQVIARAGIDLEAGRKFWSLQPIRRVPAPPVKDAGWPRTDVDRFVLAALEAKHLRPTADAPRATLLRRLSIDLTGLPPTPEEFDAFVTDPASDDDVIARTVDRLLASPAFGERWGRHWLDLARYADSNGRDENLTFHEAWRYRDWVIRAFNSDMPYDRFVAEQIAGDLMPGGEQTARDERLVASGFLILGPKVLADRDKEKRRLDVVDEQVDTVGRVFLGLTLGCARCHDHKFDPVSQKDYYALAGIFNSTHTLDSFKVGNPIVSGWNERPLGADGEAKLAQRKTHQKKLADLAGAIKKLQADLKTDEDRATMRSPSKLVGIVVDDKDAKFVGAWKPSQYTRPYVGEGYRTDDKSGKGEKSATFTPDLPKAGEYEVFVAYTPGSNRARNVPITVRFDGGETTVKLDQTKPPTLDGLFTSVGKYQFTAGKGGSVTIGNAGTEGFYVLADAVRFVPTGALEADREMAMGVPDEVRRKIADGKAKLAKLLEEEKALKATAPPEPAMAMAARDEEKPGDMAIRIRGNPHQSSEVVPRGFPSVFPHTKPTTIPTHQSGRLELAAWLTDPANPLPARVYVNRIWLHLFGEGLVRTPDNFGAQGEAPLHPELLDELAGRFVAEGWSTKSLVRLLVLSRTYRLATAAASALTKADPENRLFGRANRRRVEAEVLRDAILTVAGKLDRGMGGSAVSSLGERALDNSSKGGIKTDDNVRRSVYLPILRNELPPLLEVFDFADPDVATGQRDETTVSTQALFLMNSPFVMTQARSAAARLIALPVSDTGRLTELYRRALGRAPRPTEAEAVERFLSNARKSANSAKDADLDTWAAVCQAVFGCTEFRFVE